MSEIRKRELLGAAIAGALAALAVVAVVAAELPSQPTVLVDAPLSVPIVNADWSRCTVDRGPPIDAPAPGKVRQNYHTRNGGTA